ncbi:HNH endonuclease signature motif containing protein [Nesterenkonia massiliensis]|uniref:HNH endonuclease signature motif containing protein n=1 Tax=Nesterenkonia massiliensis TaxID=1232429 RepID=UPI0005C952B7|nr:HNH endonuclease signature motif containing protein [Nesterenkonia massiliensis]
MAASSTSSAPPMPEHLRALAGEPELAAAWEQQVAARRAEAATITALLDYRSRSAAHYAQEPLVVRSEADRAAVRDAARILGVSDRTATTILNATGDAKHLLPRTWQVFCEGLIDLPRVRKTVDAATTGDLPDDLLRQLDQAAAEQAQRRSLAEFHHWLTRYIASLDPEAYARACEKETQDRFVRFQHHSHGMSYVQAYIPTLEAAAIEKRLKAAARGMDQPGAGQTNSEPASPGAHTAGSHTTDARSPDCCTTNHQAADPRSGDARTSDPRTLAQREADLFTAWLRDGRVYDAPIDAKIMILIPETTLTGDSDEPAMAADRSWMIPAHQARNLAANPEANHDWYHGRSRENPENAEHDLLSARYIGRYPPARLRDALIFRDGTCQADGCTISAERCDIDHQTPWEHGGETTASNLWALCRRHHRMKSHGFLHPTPQQQTHNTDASSETGRGTDTSSSTDGGRSGGTDPGPKAAFHAVPDHHPQTVAYLRRRLYRSAGTTTTRTRQRSISDCAKVTRRSAESSQE